MRMRTSDLAVITAFVVTALVVSCAGESSAGSVYAPDTSYRPVARPVSAAPTTSYRPVARPVSAAPTTSYRPVARPAPAFEVCMSEGGEVYVVPLPGKDPELALSQCLALLDAESRQ